MASHVPRADDCANLDPIDVDAVAIFGVAVADFVVLLVVGARTVPVAIGKVRVVIRS